LELNGGVAGKYGILRVYRLPVVFAVPRPVFRAIGGQMCSGGLGGGCPGEHPAVEKGQNDTGADGCVDDVMACG